MVKRVCLFAHYDPAPHIPLYTRHYLSELALCGYEINIAMAGHTEAEIAPLRGGFSHLPIKLHARANGGLDFAGWQHLIETGCTNGADEVLLTNDSVFGPFRPLRPLVESMRHIAPDVWGMVRSRAVVPHLQSWFVSMSGRAFHHPAVQRVLTQPFAKMSKPEIILHGELGLGLAFEHAGFEMAARWESRSRLAKLLPPNAMHTDWRTLLRTHAVPFIKIELLRDNPGAIADTSIWPDMIPDPQFFDPDWISDYLRRTPPRRSTPILNWRGRLLNIVACEEPLALLRNVIRLRNNRYPQ